MAAQSDNPPTPNGVANNAATPDPSTGSTTPANKPSTDINTLHVELAAAARYLQARISQPTLLETVTGASESGDFHAATAALVDAFLAALDTPADPEGPSSLQGCMQEVLVWLRSKCNMDPALVDRLANGLCGATSSPSLRLRCMSLLYNTVSEQDIQRRFSLLVSLVSLASSLGMVSSIVNTVLPKIDSLVRQWDVNISDKRRMYKACYDALKSADLPDKAFSFNVKLLELYNGATEAELATVVDETVDVIAQAVRLPKLFRFDTMLELDAVSRFGKTAQQELNHLYELISIFIRDDLAVFSKFRESHEALLTKYGIDVEKAQEKMRLLTFASLGIDSPDLTYDVIASALQISEDDVEQWVIRAISSGLVDAKINQLKSSVAIYRSTQRMFTKEEWQPLSERINIWKENIGDLLTALRDTKEASMSAASEAIAGQ